MIALVLLLAVPTVPPANWTCDESAFSDGLICDCGCDAHDDDCASPEMDECATSGCPAGQVPWEHQNDQCMGSSCGDGWKADDEACDDFNALASGGCNADCSAVNEGFVCGPAAEGCEAAVGGEGEGEGTEGEGERESGEGEGEDGEGEGESGEGEGESGEGEGDGGCSGTPTGLGVALVALLSRRRARSASSK